MICVSKPFRSALSRMIHGIDRVYGIRHGSIRVIHAILSRDLREDQSCYNLRITRYFQWCFFFFFLRSAVRQSPSSAEWISESSNYSHVTMSPRWINIFEEKCLIRRKHHRRRSHRLPFTCSMNFNPIFSHRQDDSELIDYHWTFPDGVATLYQCLVAMCTSFLQALVLFVNPNRMTKKRHCILFRKKLGSTLQLQHTLTFVISREDDWPSI